MALDPYRMTCMYTSAGAPADNLEKAFSLAVYTAGRRRPTQLDARDPLSYRHLSPSRRPTNCAAIADTKADFRAASESLILQSLIARFQILSFQITQRAPYETMMKLRAMTLAIEEHSSMRCGFWLISRHA